MFALLPGLLTGFSLIMAIGAQNAFLIRQGLTKKHVPLVVAICAVSDALLIFAGIGGLGLAVSKLPTLLEVVRWFGVAYLLWFAFKSAKSAFKTEQLNAGTGQSGSLKQVVITTLALTYLNPHVYLDTVIFLGSIGNQFGENRWFFATGAAVASIIWFSLVGFGAKAAAGIMAKPIFWRVLDSLIAIVMVSIAVMLATFNFAK
jgi:L-lysine exporter family protein LysE/ArgO